MKKGISNISLMVMVYLAFAGPAFAGQIVGWGENNYGQLDAPAGDDFVVIAAGHNYSLAIRSDGSLVAWGQSKYGECNVPSGNDFAAIACGTYHVLALRSNGSLVAWGRNRYGECNVPSGNDFVAVACGTYYSLALKSDGSLVAWGDNRYGQCNVPLGNDFVAIACGEYQSVALKSDGSLVAWDLNMYPGPQRDLPDGNDFTAIACGAYHSVALKCDGSLAAWGLNMAGQCDVPDGNDFTAVACGEMQSLALKSDGSLAAWGENYYGQCDVPDRNDFIAFAAKTYHSIALVSEPNALVAIEIVGVNELRKNYYTQCKAFAYYDDGSIRNATDSAVWDVEPDSAAAIEAGLLTTKDIDVPQDVTIYAEYTEGEVTFEAAITVHIYLPQTLYVPSEYETIQAAIDAARDGDTIVVADGIYTGPGNRDIDFHGKAITVRSENGAENCIIDCQGSAAQPHRAFYFHNDEDAPFGIDGFTITNGYGFIQGTIAYPDSQKSRGGAIFCQQSSPTIANCIFSNNSSGNEGCGLP